MRFRALLLLSGLCVGEVFGRTVDASLPSAAAFAPPPALPAPSAALRKREGLSVPRRAHAKRKALERWADQSGVERALERWADQSGVERAVDIGRGEFGRGLFATRDLEAGDAALRVPLSLALSDHKMLPPLNSSVIPQLDHTTRLALNLCCEARMGLGSSFREYIDALPPAPHTLCKVAGFHLSICHVN